jgi:hypothetical protein
MYSAGELIKLGLGIVLAVRLLLRTKTRQVHEAG